MGERLSSWRHDLRETFFSASDKHLIKKPGEAAAVYSTCYCCMARQMLKYTAGHVCCICGFFLSLPAAKYSCALVPQDTSDLYQQTVCVCVYCLSVSLWTNMNSGSPPAFVDMETKWQKYWRIYQFICLYLHRSSLCLCLCLWVAPFHFQYTWTHEVWGCSRMLVSPVKCLTYGECAADACAG